MLGGAAALENRLALEEHLWQALACLLSLGSSLRLEEGDREGFGQRDWTRLRDWLESRLEYPPNLEELAAFCGLSPWQVLRRFRRHCGLPPHQWLTQLRLERALPLVLRGEQPLSQVAQQFGFYDQRTSAVCSGAPMGYRRRACASADSRFPFRSLFRGVAMQELSVLLTLAAVFAIALVSPGPDVALVVRTSLHQGRRAGLASALGLACGILLHTTLVLTGVSLLLSRTPVLFAILQALGALYLAWLGVGALRAWLRRGDGQPGRLDGHCRRRPWGPGCAEWRPICSIPRRWCSSSPCSAA